MRLVAIGLLLVGSATAAQAQSSGGNSVRFQPRLSLQTAPATPLFEQRAKLSGSSQAVHVVRHAPQSTSRNADTQVICGMTVIRKTPDADPKIVMKPERAGAAVRKIEPTVCTNRER